MSFYYCLVSSLLSWICFQLDFFDILHLIIALLGGSTLHSIRSCMQGNMTQWHTQLMHIQWVMIIVTVCTLTVAEDNDDFWTDDDNDDTWQSVWQLSPIVQSQHWTCLLQSQCHSLTKVDLRCMQAWRDCSHVIVTCGDLLMHTLHSRAPPPLHLTLQNHHNLAAVSKLITLLMGFCQYFLDKTLWCAV